MNKYKKIMAIVLSLAMVIATFAYLGANEHTNTLAGEESTDQTVAPSEIQHKHLLKSQPQSQR